VKEGRMKRVDEEKKKEEKRGKDLVAPIYVVEPRDRL
jgi:hypothetical protein